MLPRQPMLGDHPLPSCLSLGPQATGRLHDASSSTVQAQQAVRGALSWLSCSQRPLGSPAAVERIRSAEPYDDPSRHLCRTS